jgi:hydroxyacylglutathione hydrolase
MSLDVTRLQVGPFAENCYLVRQAGAEEAVVVDPGWDGAAIRLELARTGTRCAAILITHGDVDHIGAVADLAEGTGAPVHMAEDERVRLERINDLVPGQLAAQVGVALRPYTPDVLLQGDETLELSGISFETLRVPGHTAGHLAFAAEDAVFSGDVLFAGGVGRTDRPGSSWEALLESIRTLVERFPPETVVYPGHGTPTTIGRELETNPFLAELRVLER